MPEISVVLPVFNAERTIKRAVSSILGQTFNDLELLVIDDGSTDQSAKIVEAINDPRLRLIRMPHSGVAAAANTGTQQAQAPFIARMDADDYSYPERLEKQLKLLRRLSLDVVGCRVRILDAAGCAVPTLIRYENWINRETLTTKQIHALRFVEFPVVNPTILARREYFELGFQEDGYPEDYDLMLRSVACGFQFGKAEGCLFDWYDTPHRLTRTGRRYSADAFMQCRRTRLLDGPLSGRTEVDLWGAGQTGKPWLLWLQSAGVEVRRLYDVNPRKVGQTIHGVRVFSPEQMTSPGPRPLIVAVGSDGARQLIWDHAVAHGYQPGVDTWFVA